MRAFNRKSIFSRKIFPRKKTDYTSELYYISIFNYKYIFLYLLAKKFKVNIQFYFLKIKYFKLCEFLKCFLVILLYCYIFFYSFLIAFLEHMDFYDRAHVTSTNKYDIMRADRPNVCSGRIIFVY